MRTALATVANRRAGRQRSASLLSSVPPAQDSNDYLTDLAVCAASIVYKSPLPSFDGHPIFIVNAAALPDTYEVDYDSLLPYVLARLPGEDDLIHGTEYEIIFFAGGQPEGATSEKKQGPGIGWYLQAYHVLSRAMRKRLQKLYIVHPKTWIRVLVSVFSTIVSPKFRRKIVLVSDLSALEKYTPIVDLLIPPVVFLHDRKLEDEIDTMINGLVFDVRHPLPRDLETGHTRLPRILRETSSFVLMQSNIVTEGLFRIPPHSVLLDILKEAYDRGQRFIVWKEQGATYVPPGIDELLVHEITLGDAYGVHLATALIKAWYRELREPIFPDTSYNYLRTNFTITPKLNDLFTLFNPRSATSVLTTTSREILTRHLLPLLYAVSQHEMDNKMTASNLAICFAMALLRGQDQMEDARMTTTIKMILEAAITQWQELREKLILSSDAFDNDIAPPQKLRLYEDPLPEQQSPPALVEQALQWISISEVEENEAKQPEGRFHVPRIVQRLPMINKQQDTVKDPMPPPVPKRKPTPKVVVEQHAEPPRYSNVFDADPTKPRSILAGSGASDAAAPLYMQYDGYPAVSPTLKMPKRKAVNGDGDPSTAVVSQSQQIEVLPVQQRAASTAEPNSTIETDERTEAVFRKPSWPASSTRLPPKLPSLAKPVLPGLQLPSPPVLAPNLASPSFPKPRTPSPGLLQRMNTIEALGLNLDKAGSPEEDKRYKLEPGRLSLKKASVDDLRRLYEERLTTVQSLERASTLRRTYSES